MIIGLEDWRDTFLKPIGKEMPDASSRWSWDSVVHALIVPQDMTRWNLARRWGRKGDGREGLNGLTIGHILWWNGIATNMYAKICDVTQKLTSQAQTRRWCEVSAANSEWLIQIGWGKIYITSNYLAIGEQWEGISKKTQVIRAHPKQITWLCWFSSSSSVLFPSFFLPSTTFHQSPKDRNSHHKDNLGAAAIVG